MIEVTIHGRGGQGGVTLAKLIATAYFLQGRHAQAFGVYAAERSGAPLQAYVRIDDEEITNHNQIRTPDHLIVLDRTLMGPGMLTGLKPSGWVILNSADPPGAFEELFRGRQVATVDATRFAVENGLGTRAVPIVNTTIFGAAAKVLGLSMEDVKASLTQIKFGGPNLISAARAFQDVNAERLAGEPVIPEPVGPTGHVAGLFDDEVGSAPLIKTGTWANRQPKRRNLTPPCNSGCPAGNDVQGFLAESAHGNHDLALEIILKTSPLPGVCGRVCPAPCMEACNRAQFDESVNVRDVERYIAEHGARPAATKPSRGERVAIVGSGPAGLSAAYTLARLGYQTTIFEAGKELGGLLRTGIPSYRLPRNVLETEIDYILEHGVDVKYGKSIDREGLLELSREFDAVFIATGLQELQSLDLGGDGETVIQGIDFLDRARNGGVSLDGLEVVVIGGGNTAVDAARSARRIGASSVRIVYRRTRAEMPAIREEIDEALEEGVALDELVSPVRVRSDVSGTLLTCQRMQLGEPDDSGRRRPIPDTSEGSQFDLRCDRVILALGQWADLSILPAGSEVYDGKVSLGLTEAAIFTCGDFAANDGTVAAALGSGRKAAWHVHQTLTGEDLFPPPPEPVAGPEAITMHIFSHAPRREGEQLPGATRWQSFAEVRRGMVDSGEDHPAVEEAQRCFSCGVCNSCDRCVDHCPEGIMVRDGTGDGYRFDETYCKGCGLCAAECPRGVVIMANL